MDDENGYLVPVGDIDRLEQRIRQLIYDSNLRKKLAQNGRRTIQARFSAEQTAANALQVIDKVLQGGKVN